MSTLEDQRVWGSEVAAGDCVRGWGQKLGYVADMLLAEVATKVWMCPVDAARLPWDLARQAQGRASRGPGAA